jgi:hypothetical protein
MVSVMFTKLALVKKTNREGVFAHHGYEDKRLDRSLDRTIYFHSPIGLRTMSVASLQVINR